MEWNILEVRLRFTLYGLTAAVPHHRYGEVGKRLMDEMWRHIKQAGTATTGINHWVYLADGRMFVGVELAPRAQAPGELEPLQFELLRYLKHVHVGPYQGLPSKWQLLKDELAAQGEVPGSPSLEIYGHHHDDPTKLETTILIALPPKPVVDVAT